MTRPDTLIIGAGAVGQVFAAHLEAAGARIGFATRTVRGLDPLPVHRLTRRGGVHTRQVHPVAWTNAPAELAAWPLRAAWVCVPSTALDDPRLRAMLEALPPDATVVTITPGLGDRQRMAAWVGGHRLVTGAVAFMAWQSPAPGLEHLPAGVVWWMPLLGACPFDGPRDRVRPIVDALRGAGLAAADRTGRAALEAQYGSAVLLPVVAALELAGWSFETLHRDRDLEQLAAAAAREAIGVAAVHEGARPPAWRALVRAPALRAALGLARRAAPMSLEAFFRYHFTKVGSQTMAMLNAWVEAAREHHVEAGAIASLRDRLARHRGHGAA